MALNTKSPGALNAAGKIKWWSDKKYDDAEVLLRASLAEEKSAVILANLGIFYNTQGKSDEAKQYDKAEAINKAGHNLYPSHSDVIYRLAWLYSTKRYEEVGTFLSPKVKNIGPRDPRPMVYLSIAKLKLGKDKESQTLINEVIASSKTGPPAYDLNYYMAVYYSQLVDKSRMYEYLQSSIAENETNLIRLKTDPFFEQFRSDPKFTSTLRRIGFK